MMKIELKNLFKVGLWGLFLSPCLAVAQQLGEIEARVPATLENTFSVAFMAAPPQTWSSLKYFLETPTGDRVQLMERFLRFDETIRTISKDHTVAAVSEQERQEYQQAVLHFWSQIAAAYEGKSDETTSDIYGKLHYLEPHIPLTSVIRHNLVGLNSARNNHSRVDEAEAWHRIHNIAKEFAGPKFAESIPNESLIPHFGTIIQDTKKMMEWQDQLRESAQYALCPSGKRA